MPTLVTDLFANEIAAGAEFFAGGKDSLDFNPLTATEEIAVQKAWGKNLAFMAMISPTLAAQFADKQIIDPNDPARKRLLVAGPGTAMVKYAGVAKAIFPENKAITFPGEPGTIVADWLTPPAAFWVKNPDGSTSDQNGVGAYADVAGSTTGATAGLPMNFWDVGMTAGTALYLFGLTSGTYYTSRTITEKHSMNVLCQNGLIEIGTTPKLSHMLVASQVQSKYAPIAIQPLVDVPLSTGVGNQLANIYQYNTPGMIALMHNFGMRIAVMPTVTAKSRLQWLGMTFFEYDHMGTLATCWRTP